MDRMISRSSVTQIQSSFSGLGIELSILRAINRLGFLRPTPIQQKAIPIAVQGHDIIGIAQTGTGKTLAFGVPMLQRLIREGGKGLVLTPTRELAHQVNEALDGLAKPLGIRSATIVGGESIHTQMLRLRSQPRVIVATPGRLNDHLDRRQVTLDDVKVLVLDEADRMLDMGFFPQIERVLKTVPRGRQTLLFSATMPQEIIKMAAAYMRLPVRTEIAPSGTAAERVSQELFVIRREAKGRLLEELLKEYTGSVLVFVRTRRAAHKVTMLLRSGGHAIAEIHADRSLAQRQSALAGFKSGTVRILVATDIAARGIDVSGIEVVINYDLPDDPENYVHRIGRTGRAGREGHAISLATPDQGQDVRRIEQIMRLTIQRSEHPEVPTEQFQSAAVPPRPAPRFRASRHRRFLHRR